MQQLTHLTVFTPSVIRIESRYLLCAKQLQLSFAATEKKEVKPSLDVARRRNCYSFYFFLFHEYLVDYYFQGPDHFIST